MDGDRLTLRAIPALPNGWTWDTPNIDNLIKIQNAPVAIALDLFEPKIARSRRMWPRRPTPTSPRAASRCRR